MRVAPDRSAECNHRAGLATTASRTAHNARNHCMSQTVKLAIIVSFSAIASATLVMGSLFFAGFLTVTRPQRGFSTSSPAQRPRNSSVPKYVEVDVTGYCTCDPRHSSREENQFDRDFIVGGETVRSASRYPWMVSVISKQKQSLVLCGGSIIDDQHILTAAHCIVDLSNAAGLIVDRDQNLIPIGVGSTKSSLPLQEVTVKAAFVHRGFSLNKEYYSHDIAVLRLNEPLSTIAGWNTLIKPVCLPAEKETAPPRCEMTG